VWRAENSQRGRKYYFLLGRENISSPR